MAALTVRPAPFPTAGAAPRRLRWWIAAAVMLFALGVIGLVGWGGDMLVTLDLLPAHADAVVVLTGSDRSEQARRTEALRLLGEGRADHLVLSAPQVTYWGEWVPDLMHRYLRREYGQELADGALLCPHNADSTLEEAQALRPCLERRGWRSVIVVTSNYHTRRARYIWRRVFQDSDPGVHVSVHGVADGDFEPRGWWRRRRSAKTFLNETVRLVWTCLFDRVDSNASSYPFAGKDGTACAFSNTACS